MLSARCGVKPERLNGERRTSRIEDPGPSALPRVERYFLLRRWWRVLRSSLRCFFFAMRLRRFLITEPMRYLTDF